MKTMTSLKGLAFLVAVFAFAILAVANVSAMEFGQITSVEVNDVEALGGQIDFAAFAGERLPVRVVFKASDDFPNGIDSVNDVRVKAWIVGDREFFSSSDRFVVDEGKTYSRYVTLQVPFDLDPTEDLEFKISVESKNEGVLDETFVSLGAQRESYLVEVLDVDMDSQVKAGETLVLDVVLKNRGREEAEDTFIRASIPALGITDKSFFGDLSSEDQSDPDKFDSEERRVLLKIPSNVPAGVYDVEIEAYNADSATTITRKLSVVSAGDDSIFVSPSRAKTFGTGETGSYSLTMVNPGNRIAIYQFVVDSPTGLNVEASEPITVVPAGSSKTVTFDVTSDKENEYAFTVNVHSDGQLVTSEQFKATVEGKGTSAIVSGNSTVLLTVILAIVFIVLLVVLIVLLTRKPEKAEEFGESYY